MATIDQQFVEYIVKTLVSKPDKVVVNRSIDEKGVLLSLSVDPDDIGRVIGKRGVTAQSLRMLLRALGTKQDARYNLKIINGEGGENTYERPTHAESRRRDWHDTRPTAVEEVKESVGAEPEADDYDEDEDEDSSALAEKTRAEMADLDDLDI